MAYQTVTTAVTLNDLKGHSPVACLFKCNPLNICAAFYTISTTVCSHGSPALAELLVRYLSSYRSLRGLFVSLPPGNAAW